MNLTLTNRPHIVESFVNHDELASSFLKLKIKKMNLFEIVRDDEKSKQTNKDLSDVAKSKQITYGYCKVCHDVAYGIHFGIPACNGCKGFYKRSLTKNKYYKCSFDQQCSISKNRRKSCKFCRYRLCVAAGMSLDRVKLGRKSLNDKIKIRESMETSKPENKIQDIQKTEHEGTSTDSDSSSRSDSSSSKSSQEISIYRSNISQINYDKSYLSDSGSRFLNVDAILDEVLNLNKWKNSILPYMDNSQQYLTVKNKENLIFISLLRDKCYKLFCKYLIIDQSEIDLAVSNSISYKKKYLRLPGADADPQTVMKLVYRSITDFQIILTRYLKEMPGFNTLSSEDLAYLIEQRINFIYGLQTRNFFINGECYRFESDIQISRSWFNTLMGKEKADIAFQFENNLSKLELTDFEVALLIPTILSFPQLKGLIHPEQFKYLSEFYSYAFIYQLKLNNRSDEYIKNFKKSLDFCDHMDEVMKNEFH